jgi:soluble cytochrome b562
VSTVKISSHTNVYQVGDHQAGAGQLRNGFRHLLQTIQDGNLPAAQKAYDGITQSFPDFFKTLSDKLTNDYKAIGNALAKSDIAGARLAVVKLQQDLQSIGQSSTPQHPDQNLYGAQNQAEPFGAISGRYSKNAELPTLGTKIDIKI